MANPGSVSAEDRQYTTGTAKEVPSRRGELDVVLHSFMGAGSAPQLGLQGRAASKGRSTFLVGVDCWSFHFAFGGGDVKPASPSSETCPPMLTIGSPPCAGHPYRPSWRKKKQPSRKASAIVVTRFGSFAATATKGE